MQKYFEIIRERYLINIMENNWNLKSEIIFFSQTDTNAEIIIFHLRWELKVPTYKSIGDKDAKIN